MHAASATWDSGTAFLLPPKSFETNTTTSCGTLQVKARPVVRQYRGKEGSLHRFKMRNTYISLKNTVANQNLKYATWNRNGNKSAARIARVAVVGCVAALKRNGNNWNAIKDSQLERAPDALSDSRELGFVSTFLYMVYYIESVVVVAVAVKFDECCMDARRVPQSCAHIKLLRWENNGGGGIKEMREATGRVKILAWMMRIMRVFRMRLWLRWYRVFFFIVML